MSLRRPFSQFWWSAAGLTAATLLVSCLTLLSLRKQSQAINIEQSAPLLVAQIPVGLPAEFDSLMSRHRDITYEQLLAASPKPRNFTARLPFNPAQARFFELVKHRLKLTEEEVGLLNAHGLVVIDQDRRLNFLGAYQQIFTSDLPVFITTDSILHALHRSYSALLKELECLYFAPTIEKVLADCHAALAKEHAVRPEVGWSDSLRDVDIYIAVARALLASDNLETPPHLSIFGQHDSVDRILSDIQSLVLQAPGSGEMTAIYGGYRYVDYSQFKPRGHYTENSTLQQYFRYMMWLGRADCGWNVLPLNPSSSIESDSTRELRNAVLLTHLMAETGGLDRLAKMEQTVQFLVGTSDNLGVFELHELLTDTSVVDLERLANEGNVRQLQDRLTECGYGHQLIRSQVVGTSASLPAIFQLFGQRFVIDSFVLAKVVHDEIVYHGLRIRRMQPTALDVAAALGNHTVFPLLEKELQRWHYSGNLMACREFIQQRPVDFWNQSLTNMWLDSLRLLDEDMTQESGAPAAFKTESWQRKQLQTQLASWSELRHDNLLYAKQSYGVPGCAYPAGYVEPYPEFYARLGELAETSGQKLGELDHFDAEVKGPEPEVLFGARPSGPVAGESKPEVKMIRSRRIHRTSTSGIADRVCVLSID